MEAIQEKIAAAQSSGDLHAIELALKEAKTAGGDSEQIDQALSEVQRLSVDSVATSARGSSNEGTRPEAIGGVGGNAGGGEGPGVPELSADGAAAAAEAAAEAIACADAHKKRGNDRLKGGTKTSAKDALQCFTAGLEVMCSDNILNAQLYSNRAHVHILLRQFVESVDDCRKAIEKDPKNMKAYWRAAKASLHLDLFRNGIEFCEAGLQQEPNDADLIRLRAACADKLAGQQRQRTDFAASTRSDFNADEAMAVQDQVNGLGEQIEVLRSSIISKERQHLRARLTSSTVKETPEDARMHVAVGRCFLLQERAVIEASLARDLEGFETELPKMKRACQELEKRKEGAEKELKEIIHSFKQQTEQSPAGAA